jgi:hypothetical protein
MTSKIALRALALGLALLATPAWSATFWVGSSAACTGPNVHSNLASALLSAAFNGSQSDEIRLTNTVSYTGADGDVTLTDWSPASTGSLTIAGGYSDCFASPSGRTIFGNTTGVAVTVETSSQSESNVTLRRLDIRSAATGLSATGGASVVLDDVRIGDHSTRGIFVDGGAFVDIQADSIVEDNGTFSSVTQWGGGLYCNGTDSQVTLRGELSGNSALRGGNAYLSNGCFLMMMGGSGIASTLGDSVANDGGGVYIDSGGELFANGGSQRVTISGNFAGRGGAVFVRGTGRATLVNTYLQGNRGDSEGAAIYAVDGGTGSPQLTMDRASSCPFIISCSEIEGNRSDSSIIYVDNSYLQIDRTIIELNSNWSIVPGFQSLVHAVNGSRVDLGHVGMYRNTVDTALWNQGSEFQVQHATIARNEIFVDSGPRSPSGAIVSQGSSAANYLHNSIVADSTGVDLQGGSIQSECNLVDSSPGDLPAGGYFTGTPQFINIGGGDARQTSASPGVDMCLQNPLLWSSDRDIERQLTGVNDANNDQGDPGQPGGFFDAGFDENHMNVGEDYFTLTAATTGDGVGSVVSVPLGIACGSDCEEDFFNGTLVELYANPGIGSTSVFDGWIGCPLSSGNVCYVAVTEDATVTAIFTDAGDEIFSDRFETAP